MKNLWHLPDTENILQLTALVFDNVTLFIEYLELKNNESGTHF